MTYVLALKRNPYHDERGRFTTKDRAKGGGMQPPPPSSAKSREPIDLQPGQEKPPGEPGPFERRAPLGGPLRSRLTPTRENTEMRLRMAAYMGGFYKGIKNDQERAYVEERTRQMINGETRPKGMSGKFGLTKQRAIALEVVTGNVFRAARDKFEIGNAAMPREDSNA